MTWVGSFESLRSMPRKPRFTGASLEVRTWVHTEIGLISPLVEWLMGLIAASRCVSGKEEYVPAYSRRSKSCHQRQRA